MPPGQFEVVVTVEGNPPFTTIVEAADPWAAMDAALIQYPHCVGGRTVQFVVTVL